jgi:hypothetical protein
LYKKLKGKAKCLQTKRKRKPPNYKSLGGEIEEIGCPYGIFMGPEQSGRSLNEIVHVQRKKVTNYSAGKKAKNLSLQSQTPDRIPFQSSCHPVSKDK